MRKGRGKEQQGGALVVECLTLGEPNLRVELEIQLLLQLHIKLVQKNQINQILVFSCTLHTRLKL